MEIINKKILLLSTGDVNGAYEAVYKLGFFLKKKGFHVAMVVKDKTRADDFIIVYKQTVPKKRSIFELLFLKVKNKLTKRKQKTKIVFDSKYSFLSVDETIGQVSANSLINQIGFTPDFIFTGMTSNFINSTDLLAIQQLTKAQVYNIAVDMNHFTGGCHYAWDCEGYIKGCNNNCPAIISSFGKNTAQINFETKLKNAKSGGFKTIVMSEYTSDQAKKSKIYQDQKRIPNVNGLIDTDLLNNNSRDFAKRIFNLDQNKFYILMGCQNANDPRKGFQYLLESLKILEQNITLSQRDRIVVLIVSRNNAENFSEIPFAKQHIDYIKDYRLLSLLYQASDVFVNSSIEDSGPMMVSEALACGTPVVGFNMGAVSNMVITGFNGYRGILKDSNDLSKGIKSILELDKSEYTQYSFNAVNKVEKESSLESFLNLDLI